MVQLENRLVLYVGRIVMLIDMLKIMGMIMFYLILMVQTKTHMKHLHMSLIMTDTQQPLPGWLIIVIQQIFTYL